MLDRATGSVSDPGNIAKRPALPTMAWEGLIVLPSGVVIGGDELRPGTGIADSDGGAIFKFIPTPPPLGSDRPWMIRRWLLEAYMPCRTW
ncbi:MAG: hypothetical protein MPW15_26150 [Candidatus Manganitrophus sp.]|nr:hypothetical protein [Candidatus Manganitrophus sp.]